jgi:hypothetical protein
MSIIKDPSFPPRPYNSTQCLACQKKPGTLMYGIILCHECDEEFFVKPYGRRMNANESISCLSIRVPKKHPKFDSLEVYYRFSKGDTLISGKQGTLSMPIVVLPGIQPITKEFLDNLVDKLDTYIMFS